MESKNNITYLIFKSIWCMTNIELKYYNIITFYQKMLTNYKSKYKITMKKIYIIY